MKSSTTDSTIFGLLTTVIVICVILLVIGLIRKRLNRVWTILLAIVVLGCAVFTGIHYRTNRINPVWMEGKEEKVSAQFISWGGEEPYFREMPVDTNAIEMLSAEEIEELSQIISKAGIRRHTIHGDRTSNGYFAFEVNLNDGWLGGDQKVICYDVYVDAINKEQPTKDTLRVDAWLSFSGKPTDTIWEIVDYEPVIDWLVEHGIITE